MPARRLLWLPLVVGMLLSQAPAAVAQTGASVTTAEPADLLAWSFAPADVTINAGATVSWTNPGLQEHTVTAADYSFYLALSPGQTVSMTFDAPGVYAYLCEPHPWMRGTVTVLAAAPDMPPEEPAVGGISSQE